LGLHRIARPVSSAALGNVCPVDDPAEQWVALVLAAVFGIQDVVTLCMLAWSFACSG
jgi:hypothetical protein